MKFDFLNAIIPSAKVAMLFRNAAKDLRLIEGDIRDHLKELGPIGQKLKFPNLDLTAREYYERNFFSILFISIFRSMGLPREHYLLYGKILHLIRGVVTNTDNILDDEAKGCIQLSISGGKVMPNIMLILMQTGLIYEFIRQLELKIKISEDDQDEPDSPLIALRRSTRPIVIQNLFCCLVLK